MEERSVGILPPSASHTASVLAADPPARRLDHPQTGQPRVLAAPRNPFVPTPRVLVYALSAVPAEVEVGALVGCSCPIKPNPSVVRDHGGGLAYQLRSWG